MHVVHQLTDIGWSDMMTMPVPVAEKAVRTIAVYLGILVVIRVAGKRLMSQMNSFDLVVVLLLSNVVQNAVIGPDNSLAGGLLGAAVLVAANAGLERASHRYPRLRWLVEGSETTLVRDGVLDVRTLRRLGMTPGEVDTAVRHQGGDSLADVAKATISPGGAVTVDLTPAAQAATYADLRAAVDQLTAQLGSAQLRPRSEPGR